MTSDASETFQTAKVTQQDQIGLYVQEQAKLYDKWVIALGGRQDFVSSDTNNIVAGTSQDSDASKFSGRAGLVYLADNGLAPYFSYTQSFLPVVGTDSSGGVLQPETGEQYEIGVKYQPSGVDSFITASAFDLTRQNVVSINPATFASVQTGEQRSRGFELEAVGSFLDSALNITAAYTYQYVEITKSIAGDEGNRPLGVPEQLAAIYADYTIPGGALRGLGFGLGVTYQGSISGGSLDGDPANTFEVDGFTLVDAAVHYDWRKLRLPSMCRTCSTTNILTSVSMPASVCWHRPNRGGYCALQL
ncbi:MAG: TonB-dependent siderophore receptor [Gammaproteobacteria bacterium]